MIKNEILNCPICGSSDLSLKKVEENVEKTDRTVIGIFDIWKCNNCNDEFFNNWDLKIIKK